MFRLIFPSSGLFSNGCISQTALRHAMDNSLGYPSTTCVSFGPEKIFGKNQTNKADLLLLLSSSKLLNYIKSEHIWTLFSSHSSVNLCETNLGHISL